MVSTREVYRIVGIKRISFHGEKRSSLGNHFANLACVNTVAPESRERFFCRFRSDSHQQAARTFPLRAELVMSFSRVATPRATAFSMASENSGNWFRQVQRVSFVMPTRAAANLNGKPSAKALQILRTVLAVRFVGRPRRLVLARRLDLDLGAKSYPCRLKLQTPARTPTGRALRTALPHELVFNQRGYYARDLGFRQSTLSGHVGS